MLGVDSDAIHERSRADVNLQQGIALEACRRPATPASCTKFLVVRPRK